MLGGIDGFCHRRYSLPIHSHLVACANTDFFHTGLDRVRFLRSNDDELLQGNPGFLSSAKIYSEIPPITPVQSSNEQPLSALEAGPTEAL